MGNVFAAPSGEQMFRVTRPRRVPWHLYCYGNYTGDVLNFDMAEARRRQVGLDVRTVRVNDDVALAPKNRPRSDAASPVTSSCSKSLGPARRAATPWTKVERLAQKANHCTRSFGVAFGGCTLPWARTGRSSPWSPGRMELGLGVHGEPGVSSYDNMRPAAEVADLLAGHFVGGKASRRG